MNNETIHLKLNKPKLEDHINLTIPALADNFEKIDVKSKIVDEELVKKVNKEDLNVVQTNLNTKLSGSDVSKVALTNNYVDLDNKPLITNSDRYLNVATWNIHGGRNQTGTYIDLSLNSRDIVIQGSYDLIGLQELRVNYSQSHANSKDPINAISNPLLSFRKFYKSTNMPDESTADYGIGLLSSKGTIKYSQENLPKSTEIQEQRILTYAEVYVGKKQIKVFNTHVAFEPDVARNLQLSYIRDKLLSLGNESFILFGDFNVKNRTEFATYFSNWQMANGKDGVWYETYNPTYVGEKAIDNIICSHDFILEDIGVHENIFSDHNLLYAKISF